MRKVSHRICFLLLLVLASQSFGQINCNNDSLKVILEGCYESDQKIRRQLFDSVGINSPQAGQYYTKMEENDELNRKIVSSVLEKCGWLGCSSVGTKASDALFYVVQHSELWMMQKYFPSLKDMASKGEAKMQHAAMMEDRILMDMGLKQKYGTQAYRGAETNGKFIIWPVEEPNKVNLMRRIVGLKGTVDEYANEMGATFDPNQPVPIRK
ncbi:MAG: DUF6624 domain-containing protein [Bacteroidota bacterium]